MSKYLEYFDGVFDSTVVDKIKPENKPYVAYSKTEGIIYSIVPKEDEEIYLVTVIMLKDISNLTYNEVDLGEAGIWADRNIGATSTEDYGSYFQWGSKEAYTYYINEEFTTEQVIDFLNILIGGEMEVTKDNVKEVLEMIGVENNIIDIGGVVIDEKLDILSADNYFDTSKVENGIITYAKYNEDGLRILESEDDAATVYMGSKWNIPTKDEVINLINNTTQYIVDANGVEHKYIDSTTKIGDFDQGNLKGVRFEASNGNSIFLPANGLLSYLPDNGVAINVAMHGIGYYWTNELSLSGLSAVCLEMCFNDADVVYVLGPSSSAHNRIFAMPIRAIKKS